MGFLSDLLLGSNVGFDPNQQNIFNQLQGFQSPFGQGFTDLLGERAEFFRDAPALDPATAALIRAQTGAVQASTGASLGGRLAGQGTLAGGIGNQALISLSAGRQSALADALAQAAIAGKRQNLAAEQGFLGLQGQAFGQIGSQQLQALLGAGSLANVGAEFQPGLLQGLAGGIGQGIGGALTGGVGPLLGGIGSLAGKLGGIFGDGNNQPNPLLLGQGFPR